jgi:hypothetical protein
MTEKEEKKEEVFQFIETKEDLIKEVQARAELFATDQSGIVIPQDLAGVLYLLWKVLKMLP